MFKIIEQEYKQGYREGEDFLSPPWEGEYDQKFFSYKKTTETVDGFLTFCFRLSFLTDAICKPGRDYTCTRRRFSAGISTIPSSISLRRPQLYARLLRRTWGNSVPEIPFLPFLQRW
jgi:hypothetical protein